MQATPISIKRHEYKYHLPPALVAPVRDVVRRYCDVDSAAEAGPYRISSLYFDSPRRALYQQTRQRRPQRFKLRVRRYDDGPFFLEVKQRDRAVIIKTRLAIDAAEWPAVLLNPTVPSSGQASNQKLDSFVNRCIRLGAEPAVVVRYRRDAYVSRVDFYGRVTFDFQLEGARPIGYEIPIADDAEWAPVDEPSRFEVPMSSVVLELKCTTAVPMWMVDLVERFNLRLHGFSKYATAVEVTQGFPTALGPLREPSRRLFGGSWGV